MGTLVWVEVLDRRGHVRARHRVDTMPALVGRGYGCDVLIDDPWVSPIHARIYRDLDGSFKVEDAGSETGLWSQDQVHRVTVVPLGRGVILRAGQSTLRIVPADATVPPALPAHVSAPAAGGWEQWWVGATAAVAAGAAWGLTRLLGDAGIHRSAEVLGDGLLMIAMIAFWAGAWALATRAVWHRGRFLAHSIVVSVAALAMMGVVSAVEYAAFIAPGIPAFEATIVLLIFIVSAAMLYGHLTIATALPKIRIAAISTAVIFGLAGIAALVVSADEEHAAMPQFSAELKPLNVAIILAQDTTAFFAGIQELKTSVDSLAREPR